MIQENLKQWVKLIGVSISIVILLILTFSLKPLSIKEQQAEISKAIKVNTEINVTNLNKALKGYLKHVESEDVQWLLDQIASNQVDDVAKLKILESFSENNIVIDKVRGIEILFTAFLSDDVEDSIIKLINNQKDLDNETSFIEFLQNDNCIAEEVFWEYLEQFSQYKLGNLSKIYELKVEPNQLVEHYLFGNLSLEEYEKFTKVQDREEIINIYNTNIINSVKGGEISKLKNIYDKIMEQNVRDTRLEEFSNNISKILSTYEVYNESLQSLDEMKAEYKEKVSQQTNINQEINQLVNEREEKQNQIASDTQLADKLKPITLNGYIVYEVGKVDTDYGTATAYEASFVNATRYGSVPTGERFLLYMYNSTFTSKGNFSIEAQYIKTQDVTLKPEAGGFTQSWDVYAESTSSTSKAYYDYKSKVTSNSDRINQINNAISDKKQIISDLNEEVKTWEEKLTAQKKKCTDSQQQYITALTAFVAKEDLRLNDSISVEESTSQKSETPETTDEITNKQTEKTPLENITYKLYQNERYGFSIEYPDIFDESYGSQSGDGYTFIDNKRNVELIVSGSNNSTSETAEASYYSAVANRSNVNYEFQKDNWYVVSWQEKNTMYYEKCVIGSGSSNRFTISYPAEDEKLYDEIVGKLFESFKTPGIEECW